MEKWGTDVVTRVVVFSELTPKAKAQYARFLIENNVRFVKRPGDGRYVANVRLGAPPTQQLSSAPPASTTRTASAVQPTVASEEPEATEPTSTIPSTLRRYTYLIRQFGGKLHQRRCTGTYTKETKLIRLLSEIFDARYDELIAAQGAPPSPTKRSGTVGGDEFAGFVRKYLTNRFGLKALVEQQALELLDALRIHTKHNDVELFARFLDGTYDGETDLPFFLTLRNALQRATAPVIYRPKASTASAKPRRTSMEPLGPMWLSKIQAETALLIVCGSKEDDLYLHLGHHIQAFITARRFERSAMEFVQVDELLSLATEKYNKWRSLEARPESTELQSSEISASPSASTHVHTGHPKASDEDDTSPSPSPFPPPPLPRSFGSLRGELTSIKSAPALPTRLYQPPEIPVGAPAALVRPPKQPNPPDDEVQQRLQSLLARMQRRHEQHQ